MNAKDHLAKAEDLLEFARSADLPGETAVLTAMSLEAIGHALTAIAIELGAPHAATAAGGASNAI